MKLTHMTTLMPKSERKVKLISVVIAWHRQFTQV